MAKKKKKKQVEKKSFEHKEELIGLFMVIVCILSIVPEPLGIVGRIGASFSMFLVGTGYQILLLAVLILGGYLIWQRKWPDFFTPRLIGIYMVSLGLIVFAHLGYVEANTKDVLVIFKDTTENLLHNFQNVNNGSILSLEGAGIFGAVFSIMFYKLFSIVGTYIVASVFVALGLFYLFGLSFSDILGNIFTKFKPKKKGKKDSVTSHVVVNDSTIEMPRVDEAMLEADAEDVAPSKEKVSVPDNRIRIHSIDELTRKEKEEVASDLEDVQEVTINNYENKEYKLPPISLISETKNKKNANSNQIIETNIEKLEKVLKDFGINAKVVEVNVGPSVTQYELEISSGTKVNKILSLNREISLALAKKDVRIQAPIPGKSTVGIELANESISAVGLREILEDKKIKESPDVIEVALGKNIMGKNISCQIDKTPHLLVAGATGSGKSVCINCIIASILMRAKPNEVKLVLVDPKKVELSMYNGIPHLLIPVVTDPRKANEALKKIVHEMELRYDKFSEKNVKNIKTYNEWVDKQNENRPEDEQIPHMYYIVVIVDELADLMLVASKEVEDSIMRITQMARAAGIHLIVATQRPSTDVITGVVKANIPSRISFAVSSSIDSRTILDSVGAEKLLGKGDMLFLPMGENDPVRVQGAYVSDDDLQKIVDYTVEQQKAQYDERFMNLNPEADSSRVGVDDVKDAPEEYDDPLYNDIVEFVITTGKASASLLQRRFKLGYNRAARIIDLLEERGIIGPQNGSKPREVLVKLDGDNTDEE